MLHQKKVNNSSEVNNLKLFRAKIVFIMSILY
jgi:hypothetical protein